jgi:DNA-binding MarR family transcriptional regulator
MDADTLRPSGALLAAHIAVGAAIDREVASLDHGPTTLDLLTRLELAPDRRLRAVDLCRQLLKSPSHISRMLDRAESSGLVLREPDPDDRRAHQVVLTPAGRAVVEEFTPRLEAAIDRVFTETLSPTEVDQLVDLLERVEAAARA